MNDVLPTWLKIFVYKQNKNSWQYTPEQKCWSCEFRTFLLLQQPKFIVRVTYIRSTLDHSPSYYLTASTDSSPAFVTPPDPPPLQPLLVPTPKQTIGDEAQVLDDKNNNNYNNNGKNQHIIHSNNNKRKKSHHQPQIHEPAPQTGVTTATSNQSMFIPDPLRSCVIETDVSSYLQAPSSGQVHLLLPTTTKSTIDWLIPRLT